MDASTNAWIAWIGATSLWWVITAGLIAHYNAQEERICEYQLSQCLASLSLISRATLSFLDFSSRLARHGLRIAPVPDVIASLRTRKALISSPLITAFFLIAVGHLVEAQIRVGSIPKDAGAVHWWLSTFSVGFSMLAVVATVLLSFRYETRDALLEITQFQRLLNLTRGGDHDRSE